MHHRLLRQEFWYFLMESIHCIFQVELRLLDQEHAQFDELRQGFHDEVLKGLVSVVGLDAVLHDVQLAVGPLLVQPGADVVGDAQYLRLGNIRSVFHLHVLQILNNLENDI